MIPLPLLSLGLNLLGNWQKYLIIGLVILAAAGMVWMHGYGKGSSRLFEYKAEQAVEAVRLSEKRQIVTEKEVIRWRTRDRVVEKQGEVIIKEVPVYVTAADDAACTVPHGFISLWNGANVGELPPPPARANESTGRDSKPSP